MIREFSGDSATVENKTFAIIVSRYYDNITGNLQQGAVDTLVRNRVAESNISILGVPGSWELPATTLRAIKANRFDGLIVLGCVIRGETTHDQHINTAISNGISRLTLDFDVPIGFGLLTCNTLQQALDRSGGDVGNKGIEAAEAAIHMVQLFDEIAKG